MAERAEEVIDLALQLQASGLGVVFIVPPAQNVVLLSSTLVSVLDPDAMIVVASPMAYATCQGLDPEHWVLLVEHPDELSAAERGQLNLLSLKGFGFR